MVPSATRRKEDGKKERKKERKKYSLEIKDLLWNIQIPGLYLSPEDTSEIEAGGGRKTKTREEKDKVDKNEADKDETEKREGSQGL